MKNCPLCQHRPISFGAWCNGLNSLACRCVHCGMQLKADAVSWLIIITIGVAMIAVAAVGIFSFGLSVKHDQLKLLLLVCIPVILGCFVGYRAGGYRSLVTVLPKQQFLEYFVKALKTQFPAVQVTQLDELNIKITNLNGMETNSFLGNAYQAYTSGSRSLDTVIGEKLASLVEMVSQPQVNESQVLLAVVRSAGFIAATKEQLGAVGISSDALPFICEPLNEELFICYVLDSAAGMRFLNEDERQTLNLPVESLRHLSSESLKVYFEQRQARLEQLDTRGNGDVFRFRVDGNYDASVVLLPDQINAIAEQIAGVPVIFIAARDMVLIAREGDLSGLHSASHLAQQAFDELAYAISPRGLVLRDNTLVRADISL